MKNIPNNLLNYKRFIFPSFKFDGFKDPINILGGEIKWKFFHEVYEKDVVLETNLIKAPKLTMKVLHSENCKQNVPTALAIFHETTAAFFPNESSTVEFLKLFSKWWLMSNSKTTFSINSYLGNEAVNGDQKPSFLLAMAEWVQAWQTERIPNFEKFTLTAQTGPAIFRTLLCLALCIEDLPGE